MNKFDLIKLINEKPYIKNNLRKNEYGIILDKVNEDYNILFFNSENIGEYIIINVQQQDIVLEDEKLPQSIVNELINKLKKKKKNAKENLTQTTIKQYSTVELLVENKKYNKFGIHKGDIGCVVDNKAIQNYIEVDFSKINSDGKYVGDSISVKISDLKILD